MVYGSPVLVKGLVNNTGDVNAAKVVNHAAPVLGRIEGKILVHHGGHIHCRELVREQTVAQGAHSNHFRGILF